MQPRASLTWVHALQVAQFLAERLQRTATGGAPTSNVQMKILRVMERVLDGGGGKAFAAGMRQFALPAFAALKHQLQQPPASSVVRAQNTTTADLA